MRDILWPGVVLLYMYTQSHSHNRHVHATVPRSALALIQDRHTMLCIHFVWFLLEYSTKINVSFYKLYTYLGTLGASTCTVPLRPVRAL